MKIYCAASFTEQTRIRAHKERLIQLGHAVVSSWLEEPPVRPAGMSEDIFEKKMAMKDLQEIASADCVILDVENPRPTGGKMVEVGFAFAKHKLIIVVGTPPPHSIFLHLADVHFDTWDDLFMYDWREQ